MVTPTGASSVSSRTTLTIGLTQRSRLGTPDQSPWSGVSVLTILKGYLSCADCGLPPVGALYQAPRPCWQIVHELWQTEVQTLQVDNVEIALEAGSYDAPVLKAIELRRVACHLLDDKFHR